MVDKKVRSGNNQLLLEEQDGISLLTIKGDLDVASVPDVRDLLDSLLEDKKSRILVNLTQSGFIACSVISVFCDYADQIHLHGGDLKVCGLKDIQREVFGILNVRNNLVMFEDKIGAFLSYPLDIRKNLGACERRASQERRRSGIPFEREERRKYCRRRTVSADPESSHAHSSLPPGGPLDFH